jgi:hypothetical protein
VSENLLHTKRERLKLLACLQSKFLFAQRYSIQLQALFSQLCQLHIKTKYFSKEHSNLKNTSWLPSKNKVADEKTEHYNLTRKCKFSSVTLLLEGIICGNITTYRNNNIYSFRIDFTPLYLPA